MIDYSILENSVVSMLSSLTSISNVIKLPENQADLPQPVNKPRIIVAYRESEYVSHLTSDGYAQDEKVYFSVEVSGKYLNTKAGTNQVGVRSLIELAKALLLGQFPTDSNSPAKKLGNAIAFKRSGYTDDAYQDSIWTIVLVGYITTVAVQMDIIEITQLIHQITLQTDPTSTGLTENFLVPSDINP